MARQQLYASTRNVALLPADTVDAMWGVFERYYLDVRRDAFERDLRAKDHVILLLDAVNGALAGFSTAQTYEHTIGGRRIVAVFSGDTICDEKYWGQRALHGAFLRYVIRVKLRNPFTPVYWFLISKGFKTYLLLAKNFVEFWPRHDRATPPWQSSVMAALARDKFGDAWLADRGIVRFATPQGRLRGAVAPIGVAERADPHIAYFEQRNPGFENGDELCCLGRIGPGLALKYFGRLAMRALRPRRRSHRGMVGAVASESSR